jgi:uncharacterized protein
MRIFCGRNWIAGGALFLIASIIPSLGQAQDAQAIVNIVGGIMGAAMVQHAREEWSHLPPAEASCLQQGLARHGISYAALARAGVSPSDPRLAEVHAVCDKFAGRALRRNVECPFNGPQGHFITRCDEGFAAETPQGFLRVSEQDAVASAFSNRPATTSLFERADARSRRLEMIADGITGGRVPEPDFDCAKARTNTEMAICHSYELSKRDAEYGDLYKRARRFDKSGKFRRSTRSFHARAKACEGDRECLSKVQASEINYVANVLRKHGETIVTSIERDQQAKQQRQAQLEKQQKDRAEAAAASRQRAQALKTATATAKSLLLDAAAFLKSDQSNPRTLTIAEAIATLNASLKTGDPEKINADAASLSKVVHDDPNFAKYLTARSAEAAKENARHLADAIALANRQKAFLVSLIAEAPTSDFAAKAIADVTHLTDALSSPDLSRLQTLSDKVDGMLRGNNLEQRYLAYHAPKPNEASHTNAVFSLTTTNQTRFVTMGDLNDVVLLYNSSPQSPHAVRNLRGDLVFNDETAAVCFYQSKMDGELAGTLRNALSRYKLAHLSISPSQCDDQRILASDVIAFRRGDFLQNRPQYALELIKQVQAGNFEQLVTISAHSLRAVSSEAAAKRQQLALDIGSGAISGYGIVVVESAGGANVCSVVKQDADVHRRIQKQLSAHLAESFGANPTFVSKDSIEHVYEAIQRHQCSAVYASAKDQSLLLAALKRDRRTFYVDEDWISPQQVKLAADAAAKEAAENQQAENKRVEAHKDAVRLAAIRQHDHDASLAVRQAALRAQYGKIADATASAIANDLKCITTANCNSAIAAHEFTGFAEWYSGRQRDHWELMTFNSTTNDYGTVQWKGRTLPAGFVRVDVRMRNRVLGEYKDACFIAGWIVDSEFSMQRDPVDATCDNKQGIADWMAAKGFKSEWIAK